MTSLTGWPTETPHAAALLAESPVLHLLGASHTAGQILGDVSHLRFPGLCHHHHHHRYPPTTTAAMITIKKRPSLVLACAIAAIRQQV